MKKLALGIATLLFAATPAFACPDHDGAKDNAPRTAEKDKKPADTKDAKGQDKADKEKAKPDPKTAKPAPKPAPKAPSDKVSTK